MTDTDSLHRFVLQNAGIRGNLVHLDASWRAVLDTHPYPQAVREPLGEALALVTLLAATVKFSGSLILQVQGSGPIRTLVAQATSARTLRGIARWEGEVPGDAGLAGRFGAGHLVLTIERGVQGPYQGIVPLTGASLAKAVEHYFADSEQLPSRFWVSARGGRAAGLLLQRLPTEATWGRGYDVALDDWRRVGLLAGTLTRDELEGFSCEDLLRRLFPEDEIRLFDTEPLAFRCGCSRSRIEDMLRALGETEVNSIVAAQGAVEVTCEFCNRRYRLDAVDASQLFHESSHQGTPATHH